VEQACLAELGISIFLSVFTYSPYTYRPVSIALILMIVKGRIRLVIFERSPEIWRITNLQQSRPAYRPFYFCRVGMI
jgi:hypothetical protein